MSQSSTAIGTFSHAARTDDGVADDEVLELLTDADCRAIFEALADEDVRLTVQKLADACDVAQSTAYRKVERLTEAGGLGERLRIRRSGRHVAEYERRLEDVRIGIDAEGRLETRVTRRDRSSQPVGYAIEDGR